MSQQQKHENSLVTVNFVDNNSMEHNSAPHKRRRETNLALEALGQMIKYPLLEGVDEKLNKNDILSLTISRLLRRKYCPSDLLDPHIHLTSVLRSLPQLGDFNGFLLILNAAGRIIFISDSVEYYLRKNVRALYPQLASIYQCVNRDNHHSIRHLLSTQTLAEQSVICTWHLPRGKRPSRAHTESKTMLMTGHFVALHPHQTYDQQEPLFVARCEQILSSTPTIPVNSLGVSSNTTFRFALNDQLQINEISANAQSLLGYQPEELIDQSMKRFVAAEHWNLLDKAKDNCILGQHRTTINVLDLYTRQGDRLTFLCNTHMSMESRRKAVKFGFLAQLIDPSSRSEFVRYADNQNAERSRSTVQQESLLLLNVSNNKSMEKNKNLISNNDQNVNGFSIPTVCPTTVIPQRRKRRRIDRPIVIKEQMSLPMENQRQEIRPSTNDFNDSQISLTSNTFSPDSSTSSTSPIQELESSDGLFPYICGMFQGEKSKWTPDFPNIQDLCEINIDHYQLWPLLTPTMSTCKFFA